jgi:hypothetical protein
MTDRTGRIGRPLRSISIAEQRRQAKSRSNGGKAARARSQHPAPVWDGDKATAGLRAIFAELGYDDE